MNKIKIKKLLSSHELKDDLEWVANICDFIWVVLIGCIHRLNNNIIIKSMDVYLYHHETKNTLLMCAVASEMFFEARAWNVDGKRN